MTQQTQQTQTNAIRPFQIIYPIIVRGYDIDFAQVVSNIVYIRWLEDMRVHWLDQYFPLRSMIEQGRVPVLASTHIEYKRPVRLFDDPIGHMWLADIGRVRWTIQAEFVAKGEITTTAVQTGVFVDLTTLRPVPLPEALRQQFERVIGKG